MMDVFDGCALVRTSLLISAASAAGPLVNLEGYILRGSVESTVKCNNERYWA